MLESFSGLGPYIFTYGGTQLFFGFATFVVLPFLYFKVIKTQVVSGTGRFIAALVTWGVLWFIAYGDVFYIGWQAKQLCRAEAGPHVYRTAETDGFLGDPGIVYWAPYGFTYVEYQGGRIHRATMKNGKPFEEVISTPISQYERADESIVVRNAIVRDSMMVRDRKSREVLGEHVSFAIYPGWADRKFVGFTGFTFTPPICFTPYGAPRPGAGPDSQEFIKTILKPAHKTNGAHP